MMSMFRHPSAYFYQKLTRPLLTTDGSTLRTVLDARTYIARCHCPRSSRLFKSDTSECFLLSSRGNSLHL
jgi:hypothetical protein